MALMRYFTSLPALRGGCFRGIMKPENNEQNCSQFFENRIALEWISTKEAASILGITPNALRIRKCRGEIECRYFGKLLRLNTSYILSLFREERTTRKE